MEKVVLAGNVPTGTAFLSRATSGSTFAITISTFVATSAKALATVELDTDEAEDGTANCTWLPWSNSRREYNKLYHEEVGGPPRPSPERRLVRYLAVFLLAVALLSSSALFLPVNHPWQRFIEVIGSNGPQYQLQLKPENVSQWVKEQGNEIESKRFLRIDDGAIYPKSLLTDAEVRSQSWLSERYPEVDTVKSEHFFLDADYLAQPRAPEMLIDKYFHVSHCVHSMRRYWGEGRVLPKKYILLYYVPRYSIFIMSLPQTIPFQHSFAFIIISLYTFVHRAIYAALLSREV